MARGPLSPLPANIYLDVLDKEPDQRGHSYCRYADDCNIYVNSQAAAERTPASIRSWIEKRLRLKVNEARSGTGRVDQGRRSMVRLILDKPGFYFAPVVKTKVPRLSTEPQTTDRNSAGEHRTIQSESARVVAKLPE